MNHILTTFLLLPNPLCPNDSGYRTEEETADYGSCEAEANSKAKGT